MEPQHEPLLANHERIRAALRSLLAHMAQANNGDLVSALELASDLSAVMRGLDDERRAAPLGEVHLRALDAAQEELRSTAAALSYAFSVRAILERVARIAQLLVDIELSLVAPAPQPIAV